MLLSHGGGAIPYQYGRFEASALRRGVPRFSDRMRHLYYDTVLYSKDSLELLFKTVGADRCLFGTERPGVGTVKDPQTGRWLDETRLPDRRLRLAERGRKEDDLRGQRQEDFQDGYVARSEGMKYALGEVVGQCSRANRFSLRRVLPGASPGQALQKITINYPNRSGSNWPLFLAKDGGYYQKYGLDVTLTFGVMPTGIAMLVSGEAQMVNSSLEQLMQAASKDGSMVLDRQRAQSRRVRADGQERDQLHQGPEGQEDRGGPGGRRSVRIPGGSARQSRA